MSSAICQNFVQNAWKKELCSNCFKSKDEHAEPPKPKPITLISSEKVEGIIRNSAKFRPKRTVCFMKELTEIIGFGGEDWESEGEDCRDDDLSSSEEDFIAESEEEEERELKRITKENTDFNTNNLKDEVIVKKTSQLLLGKPLVDSSGRKQTLLVSVTPFGEDTQPKKIIKSLKLKENVPETKQTNVVLTSYTKNEDKKEKSLLDEITETLESGKNPIQIMSRKKTQKEIILSVSKDENKPERKSTLSRTPALKRDHEKPIIYQTSTAKIELLNNKNKSKIDLKTTPPPPATVVPPPPPKSSREQAGEPDGRADPDTVTEPPALPLTPPPALDPPTVLYDKPKIPAKPVLAKQNSTGSDTGSRVINKRKAPKPPEVPEPAPRKFLSVSTDSLASEDKRKKGRFSLKKFLRRGSSKVDLKGGEELDGPPLPKPRLVIVHPSELNGARVEVVPKGDYQNIRYSDGNDYESFVPKKPPPPPRDDLGSYKPLPHPPKSIDVLSKQKQYSGGVPTKKTETVYANIGEVRSAIVPNKPQRTASMREREAQEKKNYESVDGGENVYDYISGRSSSPDSDSSPNKNSPTSKTARLSKRSESSIDVSGEYFKYGNIPRSVSLTYCGSETESEIYSPYSFYGSESEVTEDDHDWIQNGRTHKLRSRKGRSIVHKNLEDNYGAVIVANHEALAQVLENIQQTTHIQPALRGLKTLSNLRWTDFSVKSTSQPLVVGCRTFHQAIWNTQHVTLVVNTGALPSSTLTLGTSSLMTITEFSDLVPAKFVGNESEEEKLIQATVAVLPWLQVSTIQSYGESLKKGTQTLEEAWKDASFVMLQLVNALKILQAQGIEELSLSLNSFVLCKEMDKDSHLRLCVLQGLGEDLHLAPTDQYGTLCTCASKALSLLQPTAKTTPLLQSLLNNERAVTLTQVKSILEFCLWGPSDVALGSTIRERELALQRWLDLQRATVLHGLVCARVQLTVYEECHLFFLVRSNARMMCDASLLLESSKHK
ncbi:uncharacterized protein LOC123010332 isoform X1 [Tribolium madens]|uniref:uncharacterized protein LOC123010332 isoform X1 n=1 Tax=Tribolium madens TaxID=41895 RepID=UPI001CF76547|nr:uncharacterized protein LOC123010332 isoform X1 [Tribolium madens]